MVKEIEIEWPELNAKVTAVLLEDKNPSLCKVLWENLPIETMQSHCAVSGDAMYACHSIVADVEPEWMETFEDKKEYWGNMPVDRLRGYVRFSTMGAIWGFSILWGDEFTEPVPFAPVGKVRDEDMETLRKVGKKVRDDMLFFNKYYKLIVRRKE
ncbi:MAG: hypothetical protein QXO75_11075 [Nitrososphaerota archaeon]